MKFLKLSKVFATLEAIEKKVKFLKLSKVFATLEAIETDDISIAKGRLIR